MYKHRNVTAHLMHCYIRKGSVNSGWFSLVGEPHSQKSARVSPCLGCSMQPSQRKPCRMFVWEAGRWKATVAAVDCAPSKRTRRFSLRRGLTLFWKTGWVVKNLTCLKLLFTWIF